MAFNNDIYDEFMRNLFKEFPDNEFIDGKLKKV